MPFAGDGRQMYAAAMMFPPSLPEDVRARAFRAHNGELGILPADVGAFLSACRTDKAQVLGWEVWIADHGWDADTNWPVPALGSWSGGIPVTDNDLPAVITGTGDVDETERQIALIDFDTDVRSEWRSYVRVNFTLAARRSRLAALYRSVFSRRR